MAFGGMTSTVAMGRRMFFERPPIVESLARSTIWSSTTFFSNSRSVQRARPLGGLDKPGQSVWLSFSPSKIRATAGVARCLRSTPPRSLLPPVASAPGKPWKRWCPNLDNRLSLQPAPASETTAFNNILAFSNRWAGLLPFRYQRFKPFAFLVATAQHTFFTEISLAAIIVLRRSCCNGIESQKVCPFKLLKRSTS